MPSQSVCIMQGVEDDIEEGKQKWAFGSRLQGRRFDAEFAVFAVITRSRENPQRGVPPLSLFTDATLTHRRDTVSTKSPDTPGSLCEMGFLKLSSPRIPARYFRASCEPLIDIPII